MPLTTSKTRRNSRARPDLINKLGDDLLLQILIRLPDPRSAGRCRTVCKRWSTLIFSPGFNRPFVSFRRSRSQQPPPLLLPSIDCNVLSILPVPDGIEGYFHVCDCFKDLVLCGFAAEKDDGRPNGELGRTLFICNPFSKQWVALPLAPRRRMEGYYHKDAKLVCKPTKSIELLDEDDGGGGDGGKPFVYSEYRFRVVRMFLLNDCVKLDVFCSDYGGWRSEVVVVDGFNNRIGDPYFVSWEGRLFWACRRRVETGVGGRYTSPLMVDFDPFHLDNPPIITEDFDRRKSRRWNFSVSQGAFYIFELLGARAGYLRARVSRREEDGKPWRHYEVSKKTTSLSGRNYDLGHCFVLGLHPADPKIVFLYCPRPDDGPSEALTCNLSNGELEHFSRSKSDLRIFQAAVSCWPTPIPKYKELRDMYDGSYDCWDQCRGRV